MAKLLLVRHGQTDMNAEGMVIGQLDVPLNEVGLAEARRAAAALAAYEVGMVYASDLVRASETGRIIAKSCGVPLVLDARLREASFGDLEGRRIEDLVASGVWGTRRRGMYRFKPPGGESYRDVERRVREFIAAFSGQLQDCVVVTHVGVLRVVAVVAGRVLPEGVAELSPGNGSIWSVVVRRVQVE